MRVCFKIRFDTLGVEPVLIANYYNMKICDVLNKEAILADLKSQNKKGILEELVAPVTQIANVNQEDLVKVLLERERLGSTGIGGGIGIPHGKMKDLDSLVLGFGLSRKGVDFESLDGKPARNLRNDRCQKLFDPIRIWKHAGSPFLLCHHGKRAPEVPVNRLISHIVEVLCKKDEIIFRVAHQLGDDGNPFVVLRQNIPEIGLPDLSAAGCRNKRGHGKIKPGKAFRKGIPENKTGEPLQGSQIQ